VETFLVRLAPPVPGTTSATPRELHGVVESLRLRRSHPFRGSNQLLRLLSDGLELTQASSCDEPSEMTTDEETDRAMNHE